jgi:hypothetical protein
LKLYLWKKFGSHNAAVDDILAFVSVRLRVACRRSRTIKRRRLETKRSAPQMKVAPFHIYGICEIVGVMKQESVRTTVDIPEPLYRKLKEQASARGRSIRELVLAGVKSVLLEGQRPRPKRVRFPLIVSEGPKVELTNEQIYEYIEFP